MIYTDIGWGITQIDTGFHRDSMAACFLMQQGNEFAIIETGIRSTVTRVLDFLAERKIAREQVKYVIPTHVHLDHAGGVGLFMQKLPKAKLVIHPAGARHMINPEKLQAGAIAVYGKSVFQATYGDLMPVDEAKIISAPDNYALQLGERTLTFIDTPGHARHHFCIHDSSSKSVFTGDTFGLAYQELGTTERPFLFPTTTPVQFDPEAMKASLHKIMATKPNNLLLTHYGMIKASDEILAKMLAQIDDYVAIALKHRDTENRQEYISSDLMTYLIERKRSQGLNFSDEKARSVLDSDISLNAQGLDVWLQRMAVNQG